jgi:cytochrome P450
MSVPIIASGGLGAGTKAHDARPRRRYTRAMASSDADSVAFELPARRQLAVPGPRPVPFLGPRGNVLAFVSNPLAYVGRLFERYGQMAALVFGRGTWLVATEAHPPGTVFLYGPELNRELFSQHARYHKSALSGPLYPQSTPTARTRPLTRMLTGLFAVNDEAHKEQRRLLMPAFHKKRIEGYRDDMVQVTESVLAGFQRGQLRNLSRDMNELTLRIATRTLFGQDLGQRGVAIGRDLQRWLDLFKLAGALPRDWPGSPYRRWLDLTHAIDRAMLAIIQEKRARAGQEPDILSALLAARGEQGELLSEDELIGHAGVLFAAGHETSSNALLWTLTVLSQLPEIHAALVDELTGRLRGAAPSVADLADLPLLDRVVKESLRLLPPAPLNHRIAAHDTELGGHFIPRGTELISSAYHTHRMPELFSEPECFKPERWETSDPGPYAYSPFGAGPRACIGLSFALMEIKIVLAIILQRFRLAPPAGTRVDRSVTITMRPKPALHVRIFKQDRDFAASAQGLTGALPRMVRF